MTTNTMRSQHQLGDFLLGPHFDKLRLGRRSPPLENKIKNNMNTLGKEELLKNYVKNKNSSKKERRKDPVDNEKFQTKNSRSCISRSPKSKTRKDLKHKETVENEEIKVVAMDLDEDTEEDKKKSVDLQKEIEKEQEYQNQMNMIYNSPSYFEQYSNDLEYQAEFHHPSQFLLDPQIMLQNPPMYFIAVAPESPLELVYFPSVDDSSYSSSSGWSTPSSYSETSEDESSQDHQTYHEDHEDQVPLELDEELNNLVLSIIAD